MPAVALAAGSIGSSPEPESVRRPGGRRSELSGRRPRSAGRSMPTIDRTRRARSRRAHRGRSRPVATLDSGPLKDGEDGGGIDVECGRQRIRGFAGQVALDDDIAVGFGQSGVLLVYRSDGSTGRSVTPLTSEDVTNTVDDVRVGIPAHHLHWRCRFDNVWAGQAVGSRCVPSGVAPSAAPVRRGPKSRALRPTRLPPTHARTHERRARRTGIEREREPAERAHGRHSVRAVWRNFA
jgi:hypothetical protein